MASKRHERTRARRSALQVLYTGEICNESPTQLAESGQVLDEVDELSDYAMMLIRGCESHQVTIDKHLTTTSENWSLSRMPIIDRSILRLAVFEMMFVDDVPVSVAINEAVELAKDFGAEDESPRFVNGILGRISQSLAEEVGKEAPTAEELAQADELATEDLALKADPADASLSTGVCDGE